MRGSALLIASAVLSVAPHPPLSRGSERWQGASVEKTPFPPSKSWWSAWTSEHVRAK